MTVAIRATAVTSRHPRPALPWREMRSRAELLCRDRHRCGR
jgi:hypothetical protein